MLRFSVVRILFGATIVATSFFVTLAFLPDGNSALLLSLPSWLGGAPVTLTSSQDIKIEVPHAKTLLINNFAPHRRDCAPDTDTTFDVETKPRNGRSDLKKETITLVASSFPNCIGRQIVGYAVYYTPAADFVGSDSVTIRQLTAKSAADYRFILNVR